MWTLFMWWIQVVKAERSRWPWRPSADMFLTKQLNRKLETGYDYSVSLTVQISLISSNMIVNLSANAKTNVCLHQDPWSQRADAAWDERRAAGSPSVLYWRVRQIQTTTGGVLMTFRSCSAPNIPTSNGWFSTSSDTFRGNSKVSITQRPMFPHADFWYTKYEESLTQQKHDSFND